MSTATSEPSVIVLEREMIATQEDMYKAVMPLHWRDYCAHALIPLNKCRRETVYAPWKCGPERHAYEMCQYKDWLFRQELKRQQQRQLSGNDE